MTEAGSWKADAVPVVQAPHLEVRKPRFALPSGLRS
jgi:hypothetical protein